MLGQNAVHGALAGFTSFSTGLCNNRIVYIPIEELLAVSPRTVTPNGRTIERVLSITRQPEPPRADGNVDALYPYSDLRAGTGL